MRRAAVCVACGLWSCVEASPGLCALLMPPTHFDSLATHRDGGRTSQFGRRGENPPIGSGAIATERTILGCKM